MSQHFFKNNSIIPHNKDQAFGHMGPPPYIIGFYSNKIDKNAEVQTKANTVIFVMLPLTK